MTTPGSPDFVPPSERIATFDNDGTLWSEQPMYVQLAFILDRVTALAPEHPDWKTKQPFKGVLEGDLAAVAASGERGLLEMAMATHAGMTTAEFETIASDWIASARHPKYGRPYTECVYQPDAGAARVPAGERLQDLHRLRRRRGVHAPLDREGLRHPSRAGRGEQHQDEVRAARRRGGLVRQPELDFIDDKAGKPVGINSHIGRRPILAFGNSDGDMQMLEWTTVGRTPSLALILHHTDADREAAYDRDSHIGRLDKGLDEAPRRGWVVVDMKNDWKQIFPN